MPTHDNYYTKWYTYDVKPPELNFTPIDLIASHLGLQRNKMRSEKSTQNAMANSAYEVLMKRNTKVIFLDMPQSSKLHDQITRTANQRLELNEVLKFYKTRYRIGLLAFSKRDG